MKHTFPCRLASVSHASNNTLWCSSTGERRASFMDQAKLTPARCFRRSGVAAPPLFPLSHSDVTTPDRGGQWLHGSSLSFSALPLQQLLFVDILMVLILTSVRCYLIAILVCSSLIISDIKYLFTCLMAIHISSLEKCLFRCPAHFLIGLFVALILSCMSYW